MTENELKEFLQKTANDLIGFDKSETDADTVADYAMTLGYELNEWLKAVTQPSATERGARDGIT